MAPSRWQGRCSSLVGERVEKRLRHDTTCSTLIISIVQASIKESIRGMWELCTHTQTHTRTINRVPADILLLNWMLGKILFCDLYCNWKPNFKWWKNTSFPQDNSVKIFSYNKKNQCGLKQVCLRHIWMSLAQGQLASAHSNACSPCVFDKNNLINLKSKTNKAYN